MTLNSSESAIDLQSLIYTGFMVQSVFKEDLYFQKSQTFKMCAYCFDFSIQLLMRRRSLEGVV